MHDTITGGARAAALRLADRHPGLPDHVEAALHRSSSDRAGQYGDLDPVGLASLVMNVATLAWTVYNDLRTRTPTPRTDVVQRHVRVRLSESDQAPGSIDAADLEQIITVTVTEILNAVALPPAEDDDPES
ncbi:hypothetical protein [Streptomyces sp. NPDC003710]